MSSTLPIKQAYCQITADHKIALVNDGSPDQLLELALALPSADPQPIVADLSRNFGYHQAMMMGPATAGGSPVFLIDSDLEETLRCLLEFQRALKRNGVDVVYGAQRARSTRARRPCGWSNLFHRVFNALPPYPLPANLTTTR